MSPERSTGARAGAPMGTQPRLTGRKPLIRNLLARLARGQSLLLYAGPKLGKTCLLRHLEAALNRGQPRAAAYVDLAQGADPEAVTSATGRAQYVLFDDCDRLLGSGTSPAAGSLLRRMRTPAVWAGGRTWRDFVASQAGLRLHPVPLAVLLPGEARELASPGLTAQQVDWALSNGGTHPYVLETLRAELLCSAGDEDAGNLLRAATDRLAPCFEACVQSLRKPSETRLLDHLVRRAAPMNPQEAARVLGRSSVKPEADVLAYLGLVSRWNLNEGAALQAGCGVFNGWYLARASDGPARA